MSDEKKYIPLFGDKDCEHVFTMTVPCICLKCGAFERPCCKEAADAWPTTESTVREMGEKAYTYARENFELRSQLTSLREKAREYAPKCFCGKPGVYYYPKHEILGRWCEVHAEAHGLALTLDTSSKALWDAINGTIEWIINPEREARK